MRLRDGNKKHNPNMGRSYSAGNVFAFYGSVGTHRAVTKTLYSVTNLAYLPLISVPLSKRSDLSTHSLENPLAGKTLNFAY